MTLQLPNVGWSSLSYPCPHFSSTVISVAFWVSLKRCFLSWLSSIRILGTSLLISALGHEMYHWQNAVYYHYCMHCTVLYLFFFIIYLRDKEEKDFEKGREKAHAPICWFTFQMPTKARTQLGQIQEPRIQSKSPTWVGGTPITWAITTASQGLYRQEVKVRSQGQLLL